MDTICIILGTFKFDITLKIKNVQILWLSNYFS